MPHPAGTDATGQGEEARGALAISLGQSALMAAGGVLALLITQFFGIGAGTDAFFTAYGFYVIAVAFAQTLRLTALPRLATDVARDQEGRLLAAVLGMSATAALPMLVMPGPLGDLIANGDPTGVAAQTLRLLWPALTFQLVAGVLTPMLTLRGIYSPIGLAYGLAGGLSVAAFVLFQPELGIKSVSLALALSGALLATSLIATLWRAGWRVPGKAFIDVMSIARDTLALTAASASFIVFNLGYVISLAVANHESKGSATVYAYAFFAASFFVAATAVPSALVRAPRILGSRADRGLAKSDVLSDFRLALVPLALLTGVAIGLAGPLADLLAGGFFGAADTRQLSVLLVALIPWTMAGGIGVMVVLELLNRGRALRLGWIALAHTVVLVPLSIAGGKVASIAGIALCQSLAMGVATAVQIRLAFSGDARSLTTALAREAAVAIAISAVAFAPGWAAGREIGSVTGIAVTLAGVPICVLALRRRYGREWHTLTRAFGRRRSDGATSDDAPSDADPV